ncbi:unnamed protein product, partial [Closterium sp. NIES-53]
MPSKCPLNASKCLLFLPRPPPCFAPPHAEFINLISSEANEICSKEDKRTIAPEHVLQALESLGFSSYLAEVQAAYDQHKSETLVTTAFPHNLLHAIPRTLLHTLPRTLHTLPRTLIHPLLPAHTPPPTHSVTHFPLPCFMFQPTVHPIAPLPPLPALPLLMRQVGLEAGAAHGG